MFDNAPTFAGEPAIVQASRALARSAAGRELACRHGAWAQQSSFDPPSNEAKPFGDRNRSGKDSPMNTLNNFKLIGLCLLLVAGVAACDGTQRRRHADADAVDSGGCPVK